MIGRFLCVLALVAGFSTAKAIEVPANGTIYLEGHLLPQHPFVVVVFSMSGHANVAVDNCIWGMGVGPFFCSNYPRDSYYAELSATVSVAAYDAFGNLIDEGQTAG